jgi:predicted SprT family Zn-dependent metalloprotease
MPADAKPSPEAVTYSCDACGNHMTLLAALPRTARHEAVRVYRCYGCNAVKLERD